VIRGPLVFTGAERGRLDASQLAVNELGVEPNRVAMPAALPMARG
jgi:hypothetical protein